MYLLAQHFGLIHVGKVLTDLPPSPQLVGTPLLPEGKGSGRGGGDKSAPSEPSGVVWGVLCSQTGAGEMLQSFVRKREG